MSGSSEIGRKTLYHAWALLTIAKLPPEAHDLAIEVDDELKEILGFRDVTPKHSA